MFYPKTQKQRAEAHEEKARKHAAEAAEEAREARAARMAHIKEVAGEKKHAAVSTLKDKIVPAVGAAAVTAKDKSVVAAHNAKERAVTGLDKGVEAAAPRLEGAVAAAAPAVDRAHDKIVDDILPKVQELIEQAVSAKDDVVSKTKEAADVTSDKADRSMGRAKDKLSGKATRRERRHAKVKKFALGGLLAAVGAGVAAMLKRRQESPVDPWARPIEPISEPVPAGQGVEIVPQDAVSEAPVERYEVDAPLTETFGVEGAKADPDAVATEGDRPLGEVTMVAVSDEEIPNRPLTADDIAVAAGGEAPRVVDETTGFAEEERIDAERRAEDGRNGERF